MKEARRRGYIEILLNVSQKSKVFIAIKLGILDAQCCKTDNLQPKFLDG